MKVALIGYGKMGKTIEKILLKRGHQVNLKLNRAPNKEELNDIDIAIEFSNPSAAYNNIKTTIEAGVPTVAGTTGWLNHLPEIEQLTKDKNTAFLYASNFSLGVNLFFELNQQLSQLMTKYSDYKVTLEEIHHTQKLDAPSGTAITLAEGIINHSDYNNWELVEDEHKNEKNIPIIAKRIDEVPGTHSITYKSTIDSIEIKHTAHTREGFALGAVLAAEWLQDKKGVFTMKNVLGFA